MGCARDIVETCGVARFLFSDFPLGNSAGKPNDRSSQRDTLRMALSLFDSATAPRTTLASWQTWSDDEHWKDAFMNVDAMDPSDLERRRQEFAQQKAIANAIKGKSTP